MFYNWYRIQWSRKQLWNCTHFRHPTDEQLGHVDIFVSSYYNLQSVHFELLRALDSGSRNWIPDPLSVDSGFLELDCGFQSLGFSDHYTFLGICLPLPFLSQHFAVSKKCKVFMLV